jgi:hypothetical protein
MASSAVEKYLQLTPVLDPLAQDGHLLQFGMAVQHHLCLKNKYRQSDKLLAISGNMINKYFPIT